MEVTGRRGRRRKQLLDDLKEKRGYWKLKEEALYLTLWRTRFGRGYGPVEQTFFKILRTVGCDSAKESNHIWSEERVFYVKC